MNTDENRKQNTIVWYKYRVYKYNIDKRKAIKIKEIKVFFCYYVYYNKNINENNVF